MVSYCCVKGCNNNSKKKHSSAVTFHAFPSNPDLKLKWLRAIGRPNWIPPTHARICSAHFSNEHINNDTVRTRILDHACPVNDLPPNAYFEASNVEVCRICLATDLKLHSLEYGNLKVYLEAVTGFNDNSSIDGLPQFVCYECAAQVMKCYNLVERSMVAQTILLDIFARNGEITKSLIKSQNRKTSKLTSLHIHNLTPMKVYHYQYNDEQHCSELISKGFIDKEEQFTDNDFNVVEEFKLSSKVNNKYTFESVVSEDVHSTENDQINSVFINDDHIVNVDDDLEMIIRDDSDNDDNSVDDFTLETIVDGKVEKGEFKKIIEVKGNTVNPFEIHEHFKIVKFLSLQEQKHEWKEALKSRMKCNENYRFRCQICSRPFSKRSSYQAHVIGHDPSRGKAECPVCRLRFKFEYQAKKHSNWTHSKKYYCKSCPQVLTTMHTAYLHHKWHTGHINRRDYCPYSNRNPSVVYTHARKQQAEATTCVCQHCSLAFTHKGLLRHMTRVHKDYSVNDDQSQEFRCEECDIAFTSEDARRVHLLKSPQHKKQTKKKVPAATVIPKMTCKICGFQFESPRKMYLHKKTEHGLDKRKLSMSHSQSDPYPKKCEHCEARVRSRQEHWDHTRKEHPGEMASYQRLIAVVCETCGKGFQNITKLRMHELRHSNPTLHCDRCPKLFYDKYRLAAHMGTHEDARPHRCGTCGREFKLRSNLERHSRVHSDVAPYECSLCHKMFKYSTSLNLHVRSVHQKIPLPPRKPRLRKHTVDSIEMHEHDQM